MNSRIRQKMGHYNTIHPVAKSTKKSNYWACFRTLLNEAFDIIREEKANYVQYLDWSLNDNVVTPDKW